MRELDRFKGCLIGGAVGDALGYPVEFLTEGEIFSEYGCGGIGDYALMDGIARISDDTQMTLFTAAGLLNAGPGALNETSLPMYAESINKAYLDWYKTQTEPYEAQGVDASGLLGVKELFSRRAPGNTCLSALRTGGGGTPERPINNSKGCGGVMRVAPVGLYFAGTGAQARHVAQLGAWAGALTHGHPLGWLPAAALALMVWELCEGAGSVRAAAVDALNVLDDLWGEGFDALLHRKQIERALTLAGSDLPDLDAIHILGEGWVGDEALAIAVFCAARHEDDFEGAVRAAVNHRGDSDSTGAIAGNLMGAKLGLRAIPEKYTRALELKRLISDLAGAMYNDGGKTTAV